MRASECLAWIDTGTYEKVPAAPQAGPASLGPAGRIFCTQCGRSLDGPEKFCPGCGTPVKRVENVATPPGPQPL